MIIVIFIIIIIIIIIVIIIQCYLSLSSIIRIDWSSKTRFEPSKADRNWKVSLVELLEQKQNNLFSAVRDETFSGNRFKTSIYDYIRALLTSSKDYATHFRFIWQICLGKTRKETIVSDILYKRNQYSFSHTTSWVKLNWSNITQFVRGGGRKRGSGLLIKELKYHKV